MHIHESMHTRGWVGVYKWIHMHTYEYCRSNAGVDKGAHVHAHGHVITQSTQLLNHSIACMHMGSAPSILVGGLSL